MPARVRTRLYGASRTPLEDPSTTLTRRGLTGIGVEKYISLSLSQEDDSQPLPLPSPLPSSLTKRKENNGVKMILCIGVSDLLKGMLHGFSSVHIVVTGKTLK